MDTIINMLQQWSNYKIQRVYSDNVIQYLDLWYNCICTYIYSLGVINDFLLNVIKYRTRHNLRN